MAQDFAKKRQGGSKSKGTTKKRKASSSAATKSGPRVWRWYGAGVLSGILVCFITYLTTLPAENAPPSASPEAAIDPEPAAEQPPKPRFDFYTLLPGRTIDVEDDPGQVAKARTTKPAEVYLLQAGSFRQKDDAERRRAELILLDLDPKVEESSGDNGRWFRVYVGPFESRSKLAKARSLTASQNIDTLLLKRGQP
ncbi:MAG: SPOR domain-containing protein [Halioglobus sp.]